MGVREGSARHEGRRDGNAGDLGQAAQRLGSSRADHAAAHVEHGPLGIQDQARRLTDLLGVRARDGVVAGQVELRRPGELRQRLHRVLGDVDQHRTRAAGRRQVEGLGDGTRDRRPDSSPGSCAS